MSGGSFDYLCFKSAEQLFDRFNTVEGMLDELRVYKGSRDAVEHTAYMLRDMNETVLRLSRYLEEIKDVWRAVEWHHSGDVGEDQVLAALHLFNTRNERDKPCSNS